MFELDLSGGERYELAASHQEGCGERFVQSPLCSGSGHGVGASIEVTAPPAPLLLSLFHGCTHSGLECLLSFSVWLNPTLSSYPGSSPVFSMSFSC